MADILRYKHEYVTHSAPNNQNSNYYCLDNPN